MKVLHLTHTDIRTDSRILKELLCLSRFGYDILGVGIDFYEGVSPSELNKELDLRTVIIKSNSLRKNRYIPRYLVHFLIFIEIFIKFTKQVTSCKADVVHCHDTFVLPLGVLSKAIFRSKLVYDAHELESQKGGLSKLSSLATLFLEKICWPFVDCLITVSDSIADWYSVNFSSKRTAVILNSPVFNFHHDSNSVDYLRQKFDIPVHRKIFVYVGLFGRERNILELIEVFASEDLNSNIVFIGFGEMEGEIISAQNEHHNIHYHPAVKHNDLLSIVASADYGLCLLPNSSLSDFYCLPNKLFEYIFSGIPVLASNMPEIAHLVLENEFGSVCDSDVKSIRNKVKEMENSCSCFDFSEAKLQPFTWKRQEEKLLQLYSVI